MIVVVEDHIGKRDIPFRMSFSKINAIDLKADEIELSYESSSTEITTAIHPSLVDNIKIYPNPANSHLFIQYQTRHT